jgi:hypothetical protein
VVDLCSPIALCVVLLLLIANDGQSLFTYRDLRGPLAQQDSGTARKVSASPVKFLDNKDDIGSIIAPSPVSFAAASESALAPEPERQP